MAQCTHLSLADKFFPAPIPQKGILYGWSATEKHEFRRENGLRQKGKRFSNPENGRDTSSRSPT